MKNQQRYILPLIALALLFVPKAMAQETEEAQYKTAPPQPGDTAVRVNALEYMLQKPQVSKRYEKKSFADRFFLEAGIGLNNTLTRQASTYIDWRRFGVNTNIAFGDWITPEHGVRIALEADLFRHKDISNHAKAFGFSADYMMNFSAVGNRVYEKPHRFEVIGLAGFDVLRSHISGKKKWVPGLHLGLRGQANVSRYTYIYIEPRATLYSEKLLQRQNRYGLRPALSLNVGAGYRLVPGWRINTEEFTTSGHFLENTFLSLSGGVNFLGGSQFSKWKHRGGPRAILGLGKWFSPSSGLRLSFGMMSYGQGKQHRHAKGGAIALDYMLNMHNVFGGYKPDRVFYVNALAGVSYSYMQTGTGKRWLPGFGVGLQPNVRVASGMTLFLEPRVDLYPKKYNAYNYTFGSGDVAFSLLAGINFQQTGDMIVVRERNAAFQNVAWYDHTFVDATIGASIPIRGYSLRHVRSTLSPATHIGFGKWFTALSGVRLKAEAGRAEWDRGRSNTFINLGADYMLNLSNLTSGYRPNRKVELVGLLGLDAASLRYNQRFYVGANVGLKGLWNVSPTFSLFLEPELYAYDNDFLPGTTASSFKLDLLANLSAGMQFNINATTGSALKSYEKDDVRPFYMLSAGVAMMAAGMRSAPTVGGVGRIGYGQWFSPVSAWRVSLGADAFRHKEGRKRHYSGLLTAGADYLIDITAATFGADDDRPFSVRAVAGANLGAWYERGKTHFSPDLHAGLQLAVRVGFNGWELFAEPQMAYQCYSQTTDKFAHIFPTLQLGVNYTYRRGDRTNADRPYKNFAEVLVGAGAYSGTVTAARGFTRKLTLNYGAAYGRYVSARGAVRLGINQTHIPKLRKGSNNGSDLTTLRIDYLHSLLPQDNGSFHLRGVAGVNIDMHKYKDCTRWGAGVNVGVQAAYEVSPRVEIFAEPTLTIISKSIKSGHTNHPVEGEGKLLIGTRINF